MSRTNNRSNRKESKILLIAVLGVILAAMILLMPKEPVVKAVNSAGQGGSTAAGLFLSEIMTDNASALPDENGAFGDWLEIWNSSEHPITMKNVGLSNRSDKIQFLFPEMTLEPNGRVLVFCDKVNTFLREGVPMDQWVPLLQSGCHQEKGFVEFNYDGLTYLA